MTGGAKLRGEVAVAGARNAALPLLAAALLVRGRSVFRNVPALGDVRVMRRVLAELGAGVEGRGATVSVDAAPVARFAVGDAAVRELRAATLLLGPLLARFGEARVALPGASPLGVRPFDQAQKGLRALGAKVTIAGGVVHARARRLRGATVVFDVVTVTGTETLMMAAALARGRSTLENCACEPEVEELGRVLNKMGARVHGAGTPLVTVEGVEALAPIDHAIMPDRIEAGTLMVAAAITRGDLTIGDCVPEHLEAVTGKLRAAGAEVTAEAYGVRVRGPARIDAADVVTRPFPGFPTDLAPAFLVLMTRARGQSLLTETVFEARFGHVGELARLGADVFVEGRTAVVRGPSRLGGAQVLATDPGSAAALLLAGLVAQGTTEILQISHLDRGYEGLCAKLRAVGADIVTPGAPAAKSARPTLQ